MCSRHMAVTPPPFHRAAVAVDAGIRTARVKPSGAAHWMNQMAREPTLPPVLRIPLAGLLSWILPGAGHAFLGDLNRGILIFVTIATTFWGGIAIGGVRTTVDPQRQKLWFMAQICSGGHAIVAGAWGRASREGVSNAQLASSEWKSLEIGLVYTGVAGLLNLLVIMDALIRADASHRRFAPRAKARSPAGAS